PGVEVDFGTTTEIRDLLVQGDLRFDVQADSSLSVETLEVGMTGSLEIGSVAAPVAAQASVEIVFRSEGELDPASDPDLIRRGLLGNGRVTIHGTPRTVHVKVAVDPLAGDDTLTLAEAPDNWQIGDTIVLTGTTYSGWRWDNDIQAVRYFGTRDEVRQITAIDGAEITLDAPLDHDHTTPRADLKASVANFSRNVSFRNSGGGELPVHRRAHVMLMHASHFDVRYAAFWHLGRTDKSVASFDLDQIDTLMPDSNVRGRYPLHFHISGIDNARAPAIALGNAVFGSAGWGYVHHASNAVFHNNASFDTHGAGFVAETGDEIGTWVDNIAIKAEGNRAFNPKNGIDVANFDMARTGTGFWFQGRMVRSTGNIAASVNQGFAYLHRGSRMRSFPNTAFMLPEALRRDAPTNPDDAPILQFHDNEAFASAVGLYVVKANPNQQHDIHSHFSNFTAWEVRGGSAMEYTSHYLLEGFDIIGKTPEPFSGPQFGIEFGNNTSDMVINGARIENMPEGIRLGKGFTNPTPPEANQYVVIDAEFIDVDTEYVDLDPAIDTIISSSELVPDRMAVTLNNGELLEYLSPATNAGVGLDFIGEKLDSIGPTPVPAGTDDIGVPNYEMIAICEQDGYYRDAEGTPWVIVEEYFTDRATGTIHKFGLPVRLGPEVDDRLGNPFHAWSDAFQRGVIDFGNQPPSAGEDRALTDIETEVLIDLLANDSDPDGDSLFIDGIVQPRHGLVFDNGDGTISYRPDFDFEGVDRFSYWVSDGQGHFTPADVIVRVSGNFVFTDRFQ
ncbi:MAG: cadherin-like domain-containing protein, partial [Wenzhouxiangella sp.]|nr:cadherin-like domain-containing protein [Wenzhouxiangella sp.]